jgi:hypothetical protein
VLPLLLALALAVPPDPDEDEEPAAPEPARWTLSATGGAAIPVGSAGGATAPFAGAEIAFDLGFADVGLLAQAYRLGTEGAPPWSPVLLARLEERFETLRGAEAFLAFGIGAGRPRAWTVWYQLSLGVALRQGPLSLGLEVGFEQQDLLRLAGSIGWRF